MPPDVISMLLARLDRLESKIDKIDDVIDNHIKREVEKVSSLAARVRVYTWLTGAVTASILGLALKTFF